MVAAALTLTLVLASGIDVQASAVIYHGSRARPWVALTFDDGWGAGCCEQIVRTLRSKGATATFFINGSIVRGSPSRWRAILRGFPVANHTLTHPWLTRISSAEVRRQIVENERVHERILGRPMLRLMRPPYGAYDSRVVGIADSLGYRTILWNTSGGDTAAGATTSSVIRNATRGGSGAIVLLHCGPSMTPAAVGPIIDNYRSRGYKLVGLDQMLGLEPPSPTACRVRNLDTGATSTSLQRAVDAARPGQRLTVRGTCVGATSVGKRLTIRGVETSTSGRPTLAGADADRVLTVPAGVSVTLLNLTLRNGAAALGGCLRNAGSVSLRDVTIRDCAATQRGGGIHNSGSLALGGTTAIEGNRAVVGGGVWNAGRLTIAGDGAIVGNEAGSRGGGIWSDGTLAGVTCAPDHDANVHDNTPDDCYLDAATAP